MFLIRFPVIYSVNSFKRNQKTTRNVLSDSFFLSKNKNKNERKNQSNPDHLPIPLPTHMNTNCNLINYQMSVIHYAFLYIFFFCDALRYALRLKKIFFFFFFKICQTKRKIIVRLLVRELVTLPRYLLVKNLDSILPSQ